LEQKLEDYLTGRRISPFPISSDITLIDLVEDTFRAFNAARLREACHLFCRRILGSDVTIGLSLSGALTPAGLGASCLVPLIDAGFVDWIVSTGANLYHDAHFGLGLDLHEGRYDIDDKDLKKSNVVRIYDIFFDYKVVLSTDCFFRQLVRSDEFQKVMSTSEFHFLIGKYLAERERILNLGSRSILAAAYRQAIPVYTSAPGDSSIGMNIAAVSLEGGTLQLSTSRDVNETAGIVLHSKRLGGKSAAVILGGGSPKNFLLQTESQIQEVLGIPEQGHDFFLQITDARPDTGGLSGATPQEAISWGKVDPAGDRNNVVCYLDITIALPLLTAYTFKKCQPRSSKRLYEKLPLIRDYLERAYSKTRKKGLKNGNF
jgi:deoxyhypusine synthase